LKDLIAEDNATQSPRWIISCFFKVLLLFSGAYRAHACPPFSVRFSSTIWKLLADIDRVIRSGERLNLHDTAKELGITRDHLCRTFRQQVGKTPTAFHQYRRLQFACRQLLESDHTLSEIAHQLGYADEAHMCRLFRRELLLTPTGYRKKFLSASKTKIPEASFCG